MPRCGGGGGPHAYALYTRDYESLRRGLWRTSSLGMEIFCLLMMRASGLRAVMQFLEWERFVMAVEECF